MYIFEALYYNQCSNIHPVFKQHNIKDNFLMFQAVIVHKIHLSLTFTPAWSFALALLDLCL